MTAPPYSALFLCTGNSARSIIAEGLLNHLGGGRFRAYSAGSQPKGAVNPFALEVLAANGCSTEGLRSKSWGEFALPDAPPIDFVFTVCDNAAGEACPIWPGHPMTAHWGIDDPAAVVGGDPQKRAAFDTAFRLLKSRVELLLALPVAELGRHQLAIKLRAIGETEGASSKLSPSAA